MDTPREWTRRQESHKQDGEKTSFATWACVARHSQRPASVETVQEGVPLYGVIATLVNCYAMMFADDVIMCRGNEEVENVDRRI